MPKCLECSQKLNNILLSLLIIILFLNFSTQNFHALEIKVLIFQNTRIELKSDSGFKITYRNNLKYTTINNIAEFEIIKSGVRMQCKDDKIISEKFLIAPNNTEYLIWGKNSYPGRMEIIRRENILQLINIVDIEEYIKGVLPDEMPVDWPKEALKAQAVASRTFAYFHYKSKTNKDYDVDSSMLSQLYSGKTRRDIRSDSAVDETAGEIMTYAGFPIQAFFSSTCGGETENSIDIWDRGFPYLTNIKCGYCTNSPHYSWSLELTEQDLLDIFRDNGYELDAINSIIVTKKTRSGRNKELQVQGNSLILNIKGDKFRMLLGPTKLKSLNFYIEKRINTFVFNGHGFGHGIGMCQWGAANIASQGYNYRQILSFYYKGIEFSKIE